MNYSSDTQIVKFIQEKLKSIIKNADDTFTLLYISGDDVYCIKDNSAIDCIRKAIHNGN